MCRTSRGEKRREINNEARLRKLKLSTHGVLSLESNSLNDRVRDLFDRNLVFLPNYKNEAVSDPLTHIDRFYKLTGKNDGINLGVLSQLPDEELGKITRVNELSEGLSGSRNDEGGVVLCANHIKRLAILFFAFDKEEEALTLGEETFVDETRNDVTVLQVVVVVRPKDVGRDSSSEVASKLLVVSTAHKEITTQVS